MRETAPPRWMEALLRRALSRAGPAGDTIVGDLREEHAALARAAGTPASADAWYRREAAGIAVRAAADRLAGRGSFYDRRRRDGAAGRGRFEMSRIWGDVRQAARSLRKDSAARSASRTKAIAEQESAAATRMPGDQKEKS